MWICPPRNHCTKRDTMDNWKRVTTDSSVCAKWAVCPCRRFKKKKKNQVHVQCRGSGKEMRLPLALLCALSVSLSLLTALPKPSLTFTSGTAVERGPRAGTSRWRKRPPLSSCLPAPGRGGAGNRGRSCHGHSASIWAATTKG